MIVEFLGLPGAGKTTLIPVVIEALKMQGFQASTIVEAARPHAGRTVIGKVASRLAPSSLRQPLLWQVFYHLSSLSRIRFIIRNWDLTWRVWNYQHSRPITRQERDHVLYWYFHMIGYFDFLYPRLGSKDVLVMDEGFVHRVVQLFASDVESPDLEGINGYLELIPKPDLIIYVDASSEVCELRVITRGIWEHFRHKTPQQVSRYMSNASTIVRHTINQIKQRGWLVIEVDVNNENSTNAARELNSKLSELYSFSATASHVLPVV